MVSPGHAHTDHCANMSRYVMVDVRIVFSRAQTSVTVLMKPGSACWADLTPVARLTQPAVELPTSPEQAAEASCYALRMAYPGLS